MGKKGTSTRDKNGEKMDLSICIFFGIVFAFSICILFAFILFFFWGGAFCQFFLFLTESDKSEKQTKM